MFFSGFPSFLQKVHEAAVSLQAIHEQGKDVYVSLPEELRYPSRPDLEKPTLEKPSDFELVVPRDTVQVEVPEILSSDKKIESHLPPVPKGKKDSKVISIAAVDSIKSEEQQHDLNQTLQKEMPNVTKTCSADDLDLEDQRVSLAKTDIAQEEERRVTEEKKCVSVKEQLMDQVASDDDDIGNVPLATDKSIHIHRGNRKVEVDILEGMEVTAPDLDKQTVLSKNVGKLTLKALEELENRPLLMEHIEKFRNRIKLFQIYATQKKETSLKKMEELEIRSHYERTDDQTQKYLEKLFDAMREVLRADKEMRTGKGLISGLPVHDEHINQNENRENVRDSYQPSNFAVRMEKTKSRCDDSSKIPPLERESNSPPSLTKPDGEKSEKKTSSSGDPPPPTPPEPPVTNAMTDTATESENGQKLTSSEVETYNDIDSPKDTQTNDSHIWAKSLISLLYLMKWWESEEENDVGKSRSIVEVTQSDLLEKSEDNNDSESSFSNAVNQVWYVVGLGWLFQVKAEVQCDTQTVQEECPVSKYPINSEKEENYSWYWYPIDGAYRLYSWAFKSSKENA